MNHPADPADSSCPARTSVTGTWPFPTLCCTTRPEHNSTRWFWPSVAWNSQPSLDLSKQCPGIFWASIDAADLFPWAASSQREHLWQQESGLAVSWVRGKNRVFSCCNTPRTQLEQAGMRLHWKKDGLCSHLCWSGHCPSRWQRLWSPRFKATSWHWLKSQLHFQWLSWIRDILSVWPINHFHCYYYD